MKGELEGDGELRNSARNRLRRRSYTLLSQRDRQEHRERASAPQTRLHGERSSMGVRNPLGNGEPQPKPSALGGSRRGPISPPEAIEHMGKIRGRNTDARVADRERDFVVIAVAQGHFYLAPPR